MYIATTTLLNPIVNTTSNKPGFAPPILLFITLIYFNTNMLE